MKYERAAKLAEARDAVIQAAIAWAAQLPCESTDSRYKLQQAVVALRKLEEK